MAPQLSSFAGFETYDELKGRIVSGLGDLAPVSELPGWRDPVTNEPRIIQMTFEAPATGGPRRFYIVAVRDFIPGRPTTGRWTYGGAAMDESQPATIKMDLTCVDANSATIDGHFRRYMPGQWS